MKDDLQKSVWPKSGDARGKGKMHQVYYGGEWRSRRGEDSQVRGDQVRTRTATDPDYKKGVDAGRRRRQRQKFFKNDVDRKKR